MTATGATRACSTAVLVAGGGPAGLAAAAELGSRGLGSVVIEPRGEVSHLRPRAKTTSVRTMEHFRRWGVADALRAAAPLPVAWSQRVTFCESLSGRRITDFENAFGLTTERDDRFAEAGQQVPQPVVEEVLREHLRCLPGVEVRLGHAVTALSQDADGVTVTVHERGGNCYDVRARFVLGCDGAGGVVRGKIGAAYAGRSDPRPNFNVVFRAPSLDTHLGPAVQYWVLGPAVSGLLGRLDLSGTWWAIIPGIGAAYGAAHASGLITGLVGRPFEHQIVASDPWTARMLIADRFADRRVFLVGESAHVNPPWGGHGFNACVGDAVNIAWKIAAVEQGWASARLLDSYEAERRGVIEQTVASAEANMRSLAGDLLPDAQAVQRAKRAEFHSLGLVLGYSYAGSPVVQPVGGRPAGGSRPGQARSARHAGSARQAGSIDQAGSARQAGSTEQADSTIYTPTTEPGARLPHQWLPDGSSLYDRLGTGFTLVGGVRDGGPGVASLADRARRRGIPLSLVEPPPRSGLRRDEFLLVRPDQHIAWRAGDAADIDIDLAAGFPGRATLTATS
ncbi:MAG: FAD-dependent monooxygenase [Streptosporangiaceae bacterium]